MAETEAETKPLIATNDKVNDSAQGQKSASIDLWWKFAAGCGILLSLIFTALAISLIAVGSRVLRETNQRLDKIEDQLGQLSKNDFPALSNRVDELNRTFLPSEEQSTLQDMQAIFMQQLTTVNGTILRLLEKQRTTENQLESEKDDLSGINQTVKILQNKEITLEDLNLPTLDEQVVKINNTLADLEKNQLTLGQQAATKDQISELNETLTLLERQLQMMEACPSGLIYGNECIKLAYTQGIGVNVTDAEAICRNIGSNLAEITSDAMYTRVYTYVSQNWVAYTDRDASYVDVWLGSTFQPINNPNQLITLANGTTVRLTEFRPNFPVTGPTFAQYQNMAIVVRKMLSTNNDVGLFNHPPYNTNSVPLCSYQI